jgi:hypothetical protein
MIWKILLFVWNSFEDIRLSNELKITEKNIYDKERRLFSLTMEAEVHKHSKI